MFPVTTTMSLTYKKSVFSSKLRLPIPQVPGSLRLKTRARALLSNTRTFSTRIFTNQKQNSPNNGYKGQVPISNSNHKQVVSWNKYANNWVIVTGVLIVMGTVIVASTINSYPTDKDNTDGENKRNNNNNNQNTQYRRIRIFNNNWLLFFYSTLPLNVLSRLWGRCNSVILPIWLRTPGYKIYSYLFSVQLDEMEDPDLSHYANLGEFFYRDIKQGIRPISVQKGTIACPSDGKVLQIGTINSDTGTIEQVKGLNYSIREFLGTQDHPLMCKSESSLQLNSDEDSDKEYARVHNLPISKSADSITSLPSSSSSSRSQSLSSLSPSPSPSPSQSQSQSSLSSPSSSSSSSSDSINLKNESNSYLQTAKANVSKTVLLLRDLSTDCFRKDPSPLDPHGTELYFAVIYLAPGDYHHFHSPVNWVCKLRRYFPGELFSVAPYFQRNFPNLFILNERVALLGSWKYGFFSMTAVGATNVGSIQLSFDQELVTNLKRKKKMGPHNCYEATYENASRVFQGMPLVKGEEMGGFKLGSTVVLCFEAPKSFEFDVKLGDKVKMGQKLGDVKINTDQLEMGKKNN